MFVSQEILPIYLSLGRFSDMILLSASRSCVQSFHVHGADFMSSKQPAVSVMDSRAEREA